MLVEYCPMQSNLALVAPMLVFVYDAVLVKNIHTYIHNHFVYIANELNTLQTTLNTYINLCKYEFMWVE